MEEECSSVVRGAGFAAGGPVLALLLPSWVTWASVINLFVPQFPYLWDKDGSLVF